MNTQKTKRKGLFGKILATATAGVTLGLAAYVYLKAEKSNFMQNQDFGLTKESKENMFV